MKIPSCLSLICILMLAGLLLIIPAYAETNATGLNNPSITVSVSPSAPKVGDTVVISGTANGGNLTPGVEMWIFAGNYVNITKVQVNTSGFYSRSINTAGLPPAYYYIFVQHPGSDSAFNISTIGYSGEVVNTNTGTVIFNFTGTGSVNDNAAAIELSSAFNTIGADDIFTKTGVELLPAVTAANLTTTAVTVPPTNPLTSTASAGTPGIAPTTKTPFSIFLPILGIALVIFGMGMRRRG